MGNEETINTLTTAIARLMALVGVQAVRLGEEGTMVECYGGQVSIEGEEIGEADTVIVNDKPIVGGGLYDAITGEEL